MGIGIVGNTKNSIEDNSVDGSPVKTL